jgi:hypothetical protein
MWTGCDRFSRINSTGCTLRTQNETYAYIEDRELIGQLSNAQCLKYDCAPSVSALYSAAEITCSVDWNRKIIVNSEWLEGDDLP